MVNSGSFDADGQGDRNAKAGCTQPHNAASSDSTQTSSPVTTSGITSCNSGFSSRTADSDLPAIGPTPTKTEINGAMPIENNSDDLFPKERSDDEKSRFSISSAEEKTSLCCSLPLDKVQGVLTPFHQFRNEEDAVVKAKPTRKLLCLYCDRSFVSANLRQKHVERIHSVKQNRRVSSRRQNQLTVTPCVYCDKLNSTENTLKDLFCHLINEHSTKYFGCLPCEDRFLSSSLLADHNASNHQETVSPQTSAPIPGISSTSKTPSPEEDTIEETESPDGEIAVKVTRSRVKTKTEELQNSEESEKDGKIEPRKKVVKLKELRNKKLSVKSSRIALKRRESKRLQAIAKLSECQKKKRTKPVERKVTAVPVKLEQINSTKSTEKVKTASSCINPYPEFDSFYRVKKITDHSIDNLKISSLTFDDVFDKAFFNRIKCNIEENLLHHIDGKLFKNEESENRISNFEKVSTISQETQNSSSENYGCEISLNAVTPVASLSLNSQFGEDFESQIEYGSKPSKKKTQTKTDEVHYKYFTRRKFQASILEHKENRDLSKLDMWTQLVIKKRQQQILDEKKTPKEMLEYTAGDEYKNKMKREELNRILDRRGPFEDLKEESSKKVALDKLNSASEDNISHESFTDVREVLNEILNRVFSSTATSDSSQEVETEKACNKKQDLREIPSYLSLRRASSLPSEGEIDRSDKITLICSSQETENFELPTNKVRGKNELIELSGEWARCRMYICAACGANLPNMKYLLEHKSIYHQNVWVQHYEFVGNQSELYRHLSIPALGKVGFVEENIPCKVWKRSEARLCTKCGKQCNSLGELHRHILECGGDWTWMLARKKCKYRPYGAKSRRKRRGLVHRVHLKRKTEPTEKKKYKKKFQGPRQRPSDADTIQRMLANLPAKRSTRKLISLHDGIYRARKKTQINSQLNNKINKKKVKCGKVIYKSSTLKENTEKTINTRVATNLPKSTTVVTKRTLRSISKVLSSRILDTNTKLTVRRKLKVMNERRRTRQSQALSDCNKNETKEVETSVSKVTQKNNQKENSEESLPSKRTSPRSSPKSMNKVAVKKLLTGKINIKSFFPIKKQKTLPPTDVQISEDEPPSEESLDTKVKVRKKSKDSEDSKTESKVITENNKVEQKKVKTNTFGKLVRSLSINKKKNSKKPPVQLSSSETKELSVEDTETISTTESDTVSTIENAAKPIDKSMENNNKKRKFKSSFRNVINKVKKSKMDTTPQPCIQQETICENKQFNNKDSFLGIGKENDKLDPPEQPEQIIIPSTSDTKENTADISEAVPIVMKFNETNEDPPIPETIFKLESNNEKNLQAKGELDFDSQPNIISNSVSEAQETVTTTKDESEVKEEVIKLPETSIETMQPISIETSGKPKTVPLISPNMKGKIRKPTRGLNDCIAMLTSKLQQKTNEVSSKTSESNPVINESSVKLSESSSKTDDVLDLSPTGNCIAKSVPNLSLSKPDCILKIPTFKMPHVEVEETALDLSMKSKSNPDLSNPKIENVFRSNFLFNRDKWKSHSTNNIFNSIDQTIEDVIGNNVLPSLPIKSQTIWSSIDETIQNVIDDHKGRICLEKSMLGFPKSSVDDIIEFVITTSRKMNEIIDEKPILEEKLLSTLLSKKVKTKMVSPKLKKKEDTQKKNQEISPLGIEVPTELPKQTVAKLDTLLQQPVRKRGRPKKVKVEQVTPAKTAIVDTIVQEVQNSVVDNQILACTESPVSEMPSKQISETEKEERVPIDGIISTDLPTDNKNTDTGIVFNKNEKEVANSIDANKFEDSSNPVRKTKEPEKRVSNKSRKVPRKTGQVRSKSSTKHKTKNQEIKNNPVIETDMDELLNFEEINTSEISDSQVPTEIGHPVMNLSNEDEPQLLENKILVTENKIFTPSDSEDDIPLAALVKSDEKPPDVEEMDKLNALTIEEDCKENTCDKDDEFVEESAQAQLIKISEKMKSKVTKHESNRVSPDISEKLTEIESEIKETDDSKTLEPQETIEDQKSGTNDDKILPVTQNLENKTEIEFTSENNCDVSKDTLKLDQFSEKKSNKGSNELVNMSNGKLKNCYKLLFDKPKPNKKRPGKKSRLAKSKEQIVQADEKQEFVESEVLESLDNSQTPLNSGQICDNYENPQSIVEVLPKPQDSSAKPSDHIFKTPLKRIKSSRRPKNIKRSKSLGDISNGVLNNKLSKSSSLKDIISDNLFASEEPQNQIKENQVDSEPVLDNTRTNGSIHSPNANDSSKDAKANLRSIRKFNNSKIIQTDSVDIVDGPIIQSNRRGRKKSLKNDIQESSNPSFSTITNDKVNPSFPVLIINHTINEKEQVVNIAKSEKNSRSLTRNPSSISDISESSNSFLDSSSDFDCNVNMSDKATTDTEATDISDFHNIKSTPKKPKRVYRKFKGRKRNRLKLIMKTKKSLQPDNVLLTVVGEENVQPISDDSRIELNVELEGKVEDIDDGSNKIGQSIFDSSSLAKKKIIVKKRGRKLKNKRKKGSNVTSKTPISALQMQDVNQDVLVQTESNQESSVVDLEKIESEGTVSSVDNTTESNLSSEIETVISDMSNVCNVDISGEADKVVVENVGRTFNLKKPRGRRPKFKKRVLKKKQFEKLEQSLEITEEKQTENLDPMKRTGSLRNRKKSNSESTEMSKELTEINYKTSPEQSNSEVLQFHKYASEIADRPVIDDETTENLVSVQKSKSLEPNKRLLLCDVETPTNVSDREVEVSSKKDNLTVPSETDHATMTNTQVLQSTKKRKSRKQNPKIKVNNLKAPIIENIEPLGVEEPKSEKNNIVETISEIPQNEFLEANISSALPLRQNLKKAKKQANSKNTDILLSVKEPGDVLLEEKIKSTRRSKSLPKINSPRNAPSEEINELDTTLRRPRSARNKKINYVETNENEYNEELEKISCKEHDDHKKHRSRSGRRSINLIELTETDKNNEISLSKENEEVPSEINPAGSTEDVTSSNNSIQEKVEIGTVGIPLELTDSLPVEKSSFKTKKKSKKRRPGKKKTKNTTTSDTNTDLQNTEYSKTDIEKNHIEAVKESNDASTEEHSFKIDNAIKTTGSDDSVGNSNQDKSEPENIHEPPIKLIINKQKTRRKSKSFRKIDLKGQNDLFQDFALVIKKPKRILPMITFCKNDDFMKDTYPNYLKKPDISLFSSLSTVTEEKEEMVPEKSVDVSQNEKLEPVQDLDASVEEMDMELDDEIPIISNIIERNDLSFADNNQHSVFNKKAQEAILKIPKKPTKTKNRRIGKRKSKTLRSIKRPSKKPVQQSEHLTADDENTPNNSTSLVNATDNYLEKNNDLDAVCPVEEKSTVDNEEQNLNNTELLTIDSQGQEEPKNLNDLINETDTDIKEHLLEEISKEPVKMSGKKKSKRVSKKKQSSENNILDEPDAVDMSFDDGIDISKDLNVMSSTLITDTEKPKEKDIDSIYTFTEFEDLEIEKPIEMPRFMRKLNISLDSKISTNKLDDSGIAANVSDKEEALSLPSKKISRASEIQIILPENEPEMDILKKRSSPRKGLATDIETLEHTKKTSVSKKTKSRGPKNSVSDSINDENEDKSENKELFLSRPSRQRSNAIPEEISDFSVLLESKICLDSSDDFMRNEELNVMSTRKSIQTIDDTETSEDNIAKEEQIPSRVVSRRRTKGNKKKITDVTLDVLENMNEISDEITAIPDTIDNSTLDSTIEEPIQHERLTFKLPSRIKCKFDREPSSDLSSSMELESSGDEFQIKPNTKKSKSNKEITSDTSFDFDISNDVCIDISLRPVLKRKSKTTKEVVSNESVNMLETPKEEEMFSKPPLWRKSKTKKNLISNKVTPALDKQEAEPLEKLPLDEHIQFEIEKTTEDLEDTNILESSEDQILSKLPSKRKSKTKKSIISNIVNPESDQREAVLPEKLPLEEQFQFEDVPQDLERISILEPSEGADKLSKPCSKRKSKIRKNTISDIITLETGNQDTEPLEKLSSDEQFIFEDEKTPQDLKGPSPLETFEAGDILPKPPSKRKSKTKKNSISNIAISETDKQDAQLLEKPPLEEQFNFEVEKTPQDLEGTNILDSSQEEKLLVSKPPSRRKSKTKKNTISNVITPEIDKQEVELLENFPSDEQFKFEIEKPSQESAKSFEEDSPIIKSFSKRKSLSRKNDTLNIDASMEAFIELEASVPEKTVKPVLIRKTRIPKESQVENAVPSFLPNASDLDDMSREELFFKSLTRRKSKGNKETVSDSIDSPMTDDMKLYNKSVLRKKSKNKEVIADDILSTSYDNILSFNTDPLPEEEYNKKSNSKRKSKFSKEITSENIDSLKISSLIDMPEVYIQRLDETYLIENSTFVPDAIDSDISLPPEKSMLVEDDQDNQSVSSKSSSKRKTKTTEEVSSDFSVPVEINDTQTIPDIADDLLNVNKVQLKTTNKKPRNNKSNTAFRVEGENNTTEEIIEPNNSTAISTNMDITDELEGEKTQEQTQKSSKKRSKFTREVTLEETQKNISTGAVKENNLNTEEGGRRKSVRSAKVKALEHIHDEALAELTESERNRDLEKTTLDNTDSKKSASKKSKKSQKIPSLIDNFEIRQKLLEEEKSPLFADLVADLAGLEELENSIERELNAEMNEKEETEEQVNQNEANRNQQADCNSFTDLVQDNQELRRSRRESRKITSYNENDLIDPLLDIINDKKKGKKNDRVPSTENKVAKKAGKDSEKKLNSDELFDLLKASTNEQMFMPKSQNSFLNNLDDSSRDFNIDEHFDSVFDNAVEKSNLLVSNATKTDKSTEKIYEFTDNSEHSDLKEGPFIERKKIVKRGKKNSSFKTTVEENLESISKVQELPLSEESSKNEKNDSNYCDICNKSFIRIESLIKHKRTITHIQKLSELEAREAQEKSKLEQMTTELNESESLGDVSVEVPDSASKNSLESTTADINIHNILLESEKPGSQSQIVHSAFANNDSLKLADIISDVLNKPVLQNDKEESSSYAATQSDVQPEYKRYKSLGERKSFDSDNILLPNESHILPISEPYISKTTILEKQISLLENIIESQTRVNYIDDISLSSNNSATEVTENSDLPKQELSVSKSNSKPLSSDDSFLKPTQYEEISEDSVNLRNYEDQKLRKTLNRDEELFLECCSLLKSGSEVSSYSNQRSQKVSNSLDLKQYDEPESMEDKRISENPERDLEDNYSDVNSRIPTPLGDSYDDDASDSNTISSNWDINKMAPVFDDNEENISTGFTFQEVLSTGMKNSNYVNSKKASQHAELESSEKCETIKKDEGIDNSANDKKIITKGARKVFEGLKVSIPTEELNLEEVLNCSPRVNKLEILNQNVSDDHTVPEMKDSSPPKPSRNARKSKPVKKSQVGSALLFKMKKKKMVSPPISSPLDPKQTEDEHELSKSYDVYDFEETQDNTDVFPKPDFKTFRSKKPSDNPEIESDSENRDDYLGSFVAEPESVTSSVSSSSSLKKTKAQENITKKKCMIMGRIFKSQARFKLDDIDEEMREIPIIENDELVENYVANCKKIIKNEMKPKLSEKEINQLFDQLLENKNTEKKSANSTLTKTTTKSKQDSKKPDNKKKKIKNKKRARTNSDSTDDEFSLNKTSKRSYKKSCKAEDNCINLEQELKECIGVASRKSQRKCTSGKQNVLVEYWSSDDSQFEALLESQKIEVKPKQIISEEKTQIEIPQFPPKTLEEQIESKLNEKSTAPSETTDKSKSQEKRTQHRKKATSEKKEKTQFTETEKIDTITTNRRKRAAANPLYHWSSSSEDESQDLIEVKPLRDEEEDEEDRPIQHGWIVGDSPKKLVTMLAQAKGKKTDIDCVKEQGKKRTNTVS